MNENTTTDHIRTDHLQQNAPPVRVAQKGIASTQEADGELQTGDQKNELAAGEPAKSTGGRKGGHGFWSKYTPEQRSEILRDRAKVKAANKIKQAAKKQNQKQRSAVSRAPGLGDLWHTDRSQLLREAKRLRRDHLRAITAVEKVIASLS